MQPDCAPLHGKMPTAPNNIVACKPHGHVLDIKSREIVAESPTLYYQAHPENAPGRVARSASAPRSMSESGSLAGGLGETATSETAPASPPPSAPGLSEQAPADPGKAPAEEIAGGASLSTVANGIVERAQALVEQALEAEEFVEGIQEADCSNEKLDASISLLELARRSQEEGTKVLANADKGQNDLQSLVETVMRLRQVLRAAIQRVSRLLAALNKGGQEGPDGMASVNQRAADVNRCAELANLLAAQDPPLVDLASRAASFAST
jgi:hypothetical protein